MWVYDVRASVVRDRRPSIVIAAMCDRDHLEVAWRHAMLSVRGVIEVGAALQSMRRE